MLVDEAMSELRRMGTQQARKTYRRHGAGEDMFGVSYSDMKSLTKRIKSDQALAEDLWATGNHDARALATMIVDPKAITSKCLDGWSRDLFNYPLTVAVAGVAARSPHASALMAKWAASKNEWIASAGWSLLGGTATHLNDAKDSLFETRLDEIEASIHARRIAFGTA